jgi:hypothetical protein
MSQYAMEGYNVSISGILQSEDARQFLSILSSVYKTAETASEV